MAGYRSLAPLTAAQDDAADAPVGGRARAALEREKALLLRTIKELEFDHAMGKTATAEFEEMRDRLKLRAVSLMSRLEGSDYRAAIEMELATRVPASRRAASPAAAAASAPSPALREVGTPPPSAPSTLARVCGACGGVNDVDARFCKHCGASIAEATS